MSQQQQQQKHNVAIDVAQQIGNKQPPSNQQVSELIGKTHQFIDEKKQDPNVSAQTAKTMGDFQDVLQATEQLNQKKNQDELLQEVLMETGAAGQEVTQAGKRSFQDPKWKQKGQEAGQQGKQLTQAIWSVLRSMVQSGEFRSQVSSLVGILQDMFTGAEQQQQGSSSMTTTTTPSTTTTSAAATTTLPQQPAFQQYGGLGTQQLQGASSGHTGLSDEKKRELANHFLTVLRKLNQNKEVRGGFQQLIDIFSDLTGDEYVNPPHQEVYKAIQQSDHADQAFEKSKQLIERFSERPLDPLLVKNRELFQYIRNHQQARDWFDRFTNFLREAFEKPDQIDDYEFTKRSEDLVNEANNLARDPQLKAKYTQVLSEVKAIAFSIKDDPDLRNLQEQMSKFLDNFTTTDANGQRSFNTNMMKELQSFIVPLFLSQLDQIPLPPTQGSNQDYDYYFDNVILSARDILPENVRFHLESDASLNVQGLNAEHAKTRLYLNVSNIQMKLSDIHFKFNRKTFPKMSDEGVANLRVEGNQGFALRLETSVEMTDQGFARFHLQRVDADIEKLKIDILEAKHEFLLKVFAMFYQNRLKLMIEENIEQKIKQIFAKIENGLNGIFERYPPSRLKDAIAQKANQALNAQQQQQQQQQPQVMQS